MIVEYVLVLESESSIICTSLLFISREFCVQAKRTKKVGVVGKYGTRYGSSLRKMVKKIEISQHGKYVCYFCGKVCAGLCSARQWPGAKTRTNWSILTFQNSMKRKCVGIWNCNKCQKVIAGGAWVPRYSVLCGFNFVHSL